MKVYPIFNYLNNLEDDFVNVVGIRREESQMRSQYPMWEWSKGLDGEVWRPLLHWAEQDVIEIHQRHNVRPNNLYLQGMSRVGCWPCIYARKSEIAKLASWAPERVAIIRDLEEVVQGLATKRYTKRGETFESLGHKPPTFFSRSLPKSKKTSMTPIDDVVEWATDDTALDVDPDSQEGCMRWGFCDTGNTKVTPSLLELFNESEV